VAGQAQEEGRPHVLEFSVVGATWGAVEQAAAGRIRAYTNEPRRGRYAVADGAVLRDADIQARPCGQGLWVARVRVIV
jgi:hypothetical protein